MRFGVHTSIAGGLPRAVERASALGCDCLQIFVANPRSWKRRRLSDAEAKAFRDARAQAKIRPVVVHLTYLPNLAAPDQALWQKSLDACLAQYGDAARLEADLFVLHPGSAGDGPRPAAQQRLAEALRTALDRHDDGPRLLLENMAGGGSMLGAKPEELAAVLDRVNAPGRTGVCFDTAHALAAGHPIGAPGGMARLRRRFIASCGRGSLGLIHLNDLRSAAGSHHDRHDHIGQGALGSDGVRRVLQTSGMRSLPVILETPVDTQRDDADNLAAARRLARRT